MWHFILVKDKLEVRKSSKSKAVAHAALVKAEAKLPTCASADYRVVDDRNLKMLLDEQEMNRKARRLKGAARAAATRAKNKESGAMQNFILCPTCDSKSKKLRSEMGGLQTRRCKKGHLFEVDMFFGFESGKRRIEQFDRPFFSPTGGNYNDWVQGKFKNDPTGKGER